MEQEMSKEKQIEEMAKFVCNTCEMGGGFDGECAFDNDYKTCRTSVATAEALYNAGYHKQSENVIELLCKVGDTVYQTDGIRIYELEIFDVSLRKGKPYYETETIDFDDAAIGKSIFLTREEAEAKMKGGAE